MSERKTNKNQNTTNPRSRSRVPKTRNDGTLSEAGFLGWLVQLLRKGSMRWRPRTEARKAARDGKIVNPKTGRLCHAAHCAACGGLFVEKETDVDHIDPVVPVGKTRYICSRKDFDKNIHICIGEMADRMYTEDGWAVLCKPCHKEKTRRENDQRRTSR